MTQIVDVGAASLECTSLVKGNPMVQAICFEKTGGPEVLTWQQVSVDTPGPGQVRLKAHRGRAQSHRRDNRSGLYQVPLPSGLGGEGCGVVEEFGTAGHPLQRKQRGSHRD
jgi:NADPH:quinone reductase-like Zn-dependent oxidoreductase